MIQEFTPKEKISILESMSARECLMLIAGTPYLTGSDYSETYLSQTVEALQRPFQYKPLNPVFHFGNMLDDKILENSK